MRALTSSGCGSGSSSHCTQLYRRPGLGVLPQPPGNTKCEVGILGKDPAFRPIVLKVSPKRITHRWFLRCLWLALG